MTKEPKKILKSSSSMNKHLTNPAMSVEDDEDNQLQQPLADQIKIHTGQEIKTETGPRLTFGKETFDEAQDA